MRELNFKEIDMVSGGPGGHDGPHTNAQRAAEDAARRASGTGQEYHCTQTGTGEFGSPTFDCQPVQKQAASLGL